LTYLLENRESILNSKAVKFGGSASSLNSLESYQGTSVKSWALSETIRFFTLTDPTKLLFHGRSSGYFLSSLYCDSWVNTRPQDTTLKAMNRERW